MELDLRKWEDIEGRNQIIRVDDSIETKPITSHNALVTAYQEQQRRLARIEKEGRR